MFKRARALFILIYFCLGTVYCLAQNAAASTDSTLVEARRLKDLQKFEEATNLYSVLINQRPGAGEAYLERAYCLEKLNRYDEAIKDYQIYVALNPNSIDARKKILIDYLMTENYGFANEAFVTLTNEINKLTSAYQQSAIEKIKTGNIEEASKDINLAIDNNKNDEQSWFLKGVIMDSLHNYQAASQQYIKAISCMFASREYKEAKDRSKYKTYFINLAIAQRRLMALDEAMKNINTAITYDDSDAVIYRERAILYAEKNELANADKDFNTAINLNNQDARTFYERGNFKKDNGKIQDAVGDYTNAILLNDKFKEAYVQRAWCYEHLNKFTEAKKEFAKVKELGYDKKLIDERMQVIKAKEYEYNKEFNTPEIELTAKNVAADANTIRIAKSKKESVIKGVAKDQSNIKSITVDGVDAKFDSQSNNPSFSANVPVENKESLKLEVTDVYNNTSSKTIKIERTEDTPPKIFLTTPYINLTKEIIPEDPKQKSMYLEGKIEDESLIGSITINGKKIEFNGENTNPTFSFTLDIEKIDSVVIVAADIYENSKQIYLNINRKLAEEEAKNPMGRTLIVLVENSNYQNLTALEGTGKDVSLLKSSLANYNVSRIIHKQNMNKAQMEKFFAIELRDMINKGNVKSLMIWYAGHGKYVNETGYWVPVDATKSDEFTYFPVTNLKGYLSRYKLDHTLIVSDACEAGTSFYLAMRGEPKPISCNDWEAVKLKSAQVLTSSDREGALDNSTFAKAFSNVLKYSPDHCISIDKITEKVTSTVNGNQGATPKQKPKFGVISGLEHQDGTFFFVKK